MVQDAELRVSALAVQIKAAIGLAVEVDTPVHEFLDLLGGLTHYLFHSGTVADIITCNHRVLDMLVEVVEFEVGHRGDATLCKRGVSLVERGLADHTYTTFIGTCHLQGVAHAGYAGTNHEKVIFVYHNLTCF